MPRDKRTYITVHDGLMDHPKIEVLSDAAFRLLIACWCWCSRQLTDGHIPTAVWTRRGTPKARRDLLTAGLVEETPTGVYMHDYIEHQRTAAEVQEQRITKSESGQLGAHKRWHRKRKAEGCPLCFPHSDGKPMAPPMANA